MRILITPDIDTWAIGSLGSTIQRFNQRFDFIKVTVHPRAVGEKFLEIRNAISQGVDLWHPLYWRSATQLMEFFPELKNIPKLLTHMNHNNLKDGDWRVFNGVACATNYAADLLRKEHDNVYKIPYGIDLDRFYYLDNLPAENTIGYVGRVVPWKNLDKICLAANKLGYKVVGSGYVDDPKYWPTINKTNLTFRGGIGRNTMAPSNVKDDLYKQMTVFVMYSTGEKESGTLPLLEAMASGVPVMVTEQGMARDLIEDGKNGIVFNEENFEEKLKMLMEDKPLREKLRQAAWNTIRHYPDTLYARNYARAYYDILFNKQPVVSVIIPTFNNWENLIDSVKAIEDDPYPAKEIIIVDDGSTDITKETCIKLRQTIKTPMVYLNTGDTVGYNLAKARNMGAVEALGKVLLFLDDRLKLDGISLAHIAQVQPSQWRHGKKMTKEGESTKRAFMENFSWIQKRDFVRGGMFNERMNIYGGLSQITREVYKDKVEFIYDDQAACIEMKRSGVKDRKSKIWKAKDLLDKMLT